MERIVAPPTLDLSRRRFLQGLAQRVVYGPSALATEWLREPLV